MLDAVSFRPLSAQDRPLLELATLGNLNWVEERFTAVDVRTRPEFAHYTALDAGRGDFGWVARLGGEPVGVGWAQFLPADDPGYGFVAENVPEASLWVRGDCRGRGVGRALLHRLQDDARGRGVARLSLSVEAGNPARRLYLTAGFVPVPGRDADGVMLWSAGC